MRWWLIKPKGPRRTDIGYALDSCSVGPARSIPSPGIPPYSESSTCAHVFPSPAPYEPLGSPCIRLDPVCSERHGISRALCQALDGRARHRPRRSDEGPRRRHDLLVHWRSVGSPINCHFVYGLERILTGAFVGLICWLGFFAATQFPQGIYENRPLKLFAINAGYWFVGLLIIGGLLAAWR